MHVVRTANERFRARVRVHRLAALAHPARAERRSDCFGGRVAQHRVAVLVVLGHLEKRVDGAVAEFGPVARKAKRCFAAHREHVVLQQRDQLGLAVVAQALAEHARCDRAHVGVAVVREREQWLRRGGILARKDAEAKHCAQPSLAGVDVLRDREQRAARVLVHERELRVLANAAIFVAQQLDELRLLHLGKVAAEQPRSLARAEVTAHLLGLDAIEATLARLVPTADPIAHIHRAVGSEVDVRRERVPHRSIAPCDLEASAFGRQAQRVDAAVAAAAAEVAEEEAVAIARGHPMAHVVDEARRTVGHVVDRHERRKRALLVERHPHAFAVPCAAVIEPLEADAPAAVGAVDDLHESRAIAAVAVVVAGQQVAKVVEREFLRVAQAAVHDFEVAAV